MPHELTDDYSWDWDEERAQELFDAYARYGNSGASFKKQDIKMSGKNMDKWLREAGVIDGTTVTTIVTGIAFSKVIGRTAKTVDFLHSKKVILNIASAKAKKINGDTQEILTEFCGQMTSLSGPSNEGTTKVGIPKDMYNRLSDNSQTSKERNEARQKRR